MTRAIFALTTILICCASTIAQPLPPPEIPDIPYYVPPEYAVDARAASYFVTTTADEDDGICGGGTGISLREAIVYCAQAATSAVVYIPDGTYTLTSEIAVTDRAIRLIGESRDGTIITTAANDHRHLKVMSTGYEFGLFNLAFLHGNSGSEAGGSLYIVGGSRLDSYNIYYGMNSGYDGAAMYVASSGGGLLHASINRTEFVGNGTSAALSIVPGEQSQIVVTNSLFESNLGSAISFFSGPVASSLTVSASRFIDNGSDSVGGGILTVTTVSNYTTSFHVADSIFERNRAGGGAILVLGFDFGQLTMSVERSAFLDNTMGGAIQVSVLPFASILIQDSSFVGNQSAVYAAAISITAHVGSVTIDGIQAKNNAVQSMSGGIGGALSVFAGRVSVSNSYFDGNEADYCGGLHVSADFAGTVARTEVRNNRANVYGGGMCVLSPGSIYLTEVTVVGNRAESDDGLARSAGGLRLSSTGGFIQDSLIEDNFAAVAGPDCLSVGASLISLGGNAITDTSGCNYVAHPTDRIDNLLDNGGFEFAAGDPAVPDAWTAKNLTGDKRRCNTSAKSFTDYGSCALVFKGGPGESAQFAQDVNLLTHTFSTGEVLDLYAMGWGGPAGSVVVQAKATYTDPLLAATKAKLVLQGSAVAVEDVNAFALAGGDLTQLTVKVKHKSPSGKMTVDRVYLTRSLATPRGPEFGLLPPPAAPDSFRGGN